MYHTREITSSNHGQNSSTPYRVFYTTAPRVNGVKAILHNQLRKDGYGHLLKTCKPGEPRIIRVKVLPKEDLYSPEKGNNPAISESLPCDKAIPAVVKSLQCDKAILAVDKAIPAVSKSLPQDKAPSAIGKSLACNKALPAVHKSLPYYKALPSDSKSLPCDKALPVVGKSLPCDKTLGYIDNILNNPVVYQRPFHVKKRKRKRRKRKPSLIQHEPKDKNGKNKSKKHIPSPPSLVSSSSSPSSHTSSSCSSPSKTPGPSNENNIAESTMGSLTQAIFRGISYRGDQQHESCFNLSSNSNSNINDNQNVLLLPSTPSPKEFPYQVNLIKTTNVGEKRSSKKVHVEVDLKRARKMERDESVISVKEASCSTDKQHNKSQVVQLETHPKRNDSNTGSSGTNKNTDKAQFHEISSCTEANVSSHLGALSKTNQKGRTDRVPKLSHQQKREKDSHYESKNSDTPVSVRFKKKLPHPQKHRLSNDTSQCNDIQECQIIDQIQKFQITKHVQKCRIIDLKDSSEEGNLEEKSKSASDCTGSPVHSLAEKVSAVDGVEIQNAKSRTVLTSSLKHKKTQGSGERLLKLGSADKTIASEETFCSHTNIPETESTVYFSSNSDFEIDEIEENASVCSNKVLTKREPKENTHISLSEVIENDNKGLMKQSRIAEEQNDVPSSNTSVSLDVSSISSTSTEMLHPTGKTCLQKVVLVLHNHFGRTLDESFQVLQRNSFNLLTTIMELQKLHLPLEEAL